ncbi:MAG: hypothetical protein WCG76_07025, partial [Verrucomicrobiota bacterium]
MSVGLFERRPKAADGHRPTLQPAGFADREVRSTASPLEFRGKFCWFGRVGILTDSRSISLWKTGWPETAGP